MVGAQEVATQVERTVKIAFVLGQFPALSETFILNQITSLIERGSASPYAPLFALLGALLGGLVLGSVLETVGHGAFSSGRWLGYHHRFEASF